MQTTSFLKIWLLSLSLGKFTPMHKPAFRDDQVERLDYRVEFLKVNGEQTNFQELLCLH